MLMATYKSAKALTASAWKASKVCEKYKVSWFKLYINVEQVLDLNLITQDYVGHFWAWCTCNSKMFKGKKCTS